MPLGAVVVVARLQRRTLKMSRRQKSWQETAFEEITPANSRSVYRSLSQTVYQGLSALPSAIPRWPMGSSTGSFTTPNELKYADTRCENIATDRQDEVGVVPGNLPVLRFGPNSNQFSDGLSTPSMTKTSIDPFCGSSFNPSCSWTAVNMDTELDSKWRRGIARKLQLEVVESGKSSVIDHRTVSGA